MRMSDWSSDVFSSDLREARCDRGSSCAASAARPSRQAGLRVRSVVPGLASQRCLIHPPPCAAFRHPPGFSPDGEGSGLFFKETLMGWTRSEEHTSELQSLMRISYAASCLKQKKQPAK